MSKHSLQQVTYRDDPHMVGTLDRVEHEWETIHASPSGENEYGRGTRTEVASLLPRLSTLHTYLQVTESWAGLGMRCLV